MAREEYEKIELLKEDIKQTFEDSGFACHDDSVAKWFELVDDESVYVYPSLPSEEISAGALARAIQKVERELGKSDIPLKLTIVCHVPGDFAFLVSLV